MSWIDRIANRLKTDLIKSLTESGFISIESLLRYNDDYAFDNSRDIPSIAKVQQLIDDSGGSAALTYTFTGADVVDGAIDLTVQTDMPVAGTIPSGLRVYADDVDYSQSAAYTPSTQIVFAGLTGDETEITIKITF